jgi:hypothetical protein
MKFEDWPLHDAVFQEAHVDWKNRTCTLQILAFVDRTADAVPCRLIWQGLRKLLLPVENPWGPSVFINRQWSEANGKYSIEMQSGDVVTIEADTATFVRA